MLQLYGSGNFTNKSGEPTNLHYGLAQPDIPYTSRQAHEVMADHIEHTLDIKDGDRILDAGCGIGSLDFRLAKKYPGAQIVGINITQPQLVFAQKHKIKISSTDSSPHFALADFSYLPFPPKLFNTAFFVESICHSPDIEKTLNEIGRVLKNNGKLVIYDSFSQLPANTEDEDISALNKLWLGPSISPITQVEQLISTRFDEYKIIPLTQQVLPSARRLALKSILQEGNKGYFPRVATILKELMETEKVGYFQIVASRPRIKE